MRYAVPSLLLAALFAALFAAPGAVRGAAQDGTPAPADGEVPPSEACAVPPRSVEEVLTLVGAGEGTPVPEPPPAVLTAPLGEPAGGEDARAMAATVEELVACLNAGDELRAAALFTDAGVRRFVLGEEEADAEALRETLSATPEPLAEEQRLRLVAVTDEAIRPDGRAAALAVIDPPARRLDPQVFLATFEQQGDRWLLEGLIALGLPAPAATPAATPAP